MRINNTIGAELELATVHTQQKDTYLMEIDGKTIRDFLINCGNPDFNSENLGEEELSHIVEIITPEMDSIQDIINYITDRVDSINEVLSIFGGKLEAHHYPRHIIDTSNPSNLTKRGRELAQKDQTWLDRLVDAAVCAWQITSSQIIHDLFEEAQTNAETKNELQMKKYVIALYLHILRNMDSDISKIKRQNSQNPDRISKTSILLEEVKTSSFPNKTKYRYNFQGESIEEYIAFIIETAYSTDKGLNAKYAHHIYAKLKFNYQANPHIQQFLKDLSKESYKNKIKILKNNPNLLDQILHCLDPYAIEFRPFDATLSRKKMLRYYDYTLEVSKHSINSTLASISSCPQSLKAPEEYQPSNPLPAFHPAE